MTTLSRTPRSLILSAQPYVATFLASAVFVLLILSAPITAADIPGFYAFHEGEQFQNIATMRRYWSGQAEFPIFVHGAMDYIPALIGQAMAGENRVIFGGRLALLLVSILTWLIFVLQVVYLFRWKKLEPMYLAITLGLFALSFSTQEMAMVFVMEGTLGRRDLFIVMQSFALLVFCTAAARRTRQASLAVLFALVPFSLGWSYDRGVAATAGCALVGGIFLLRRDFANVLLAVASLAVSAAFMWATGLFGRPHEYLLNILYWSRNSADIWSTNPSLGPGLLFASLPLLFVGLVFAVALRDKEMRGGPVLYYIAFFAVVELLLLKSAFNRPLLHRTLAVCWPALCMALALWPAREPSGESPRPRSGVEELLRGGVGVLIFCVIMLFVEWTITPTLRKMVELAPRSSAQVERLIASIPTDEQLSEPAAVQVASLLKDGACQLNWANQGMVAVLVSLPHCTRYPYLIYVSSEGQDDLIDEIRANPPNHVIIDSKDFAIAIDEKPMRDRLPKVHAFLVRNYPHASAIGRFVVLSRRPPGRVAT